MSRYRYIFWDDLRQSETIWDDLRRFETKQIYLLRQTETSEIYLSLDIGNSTAATVFHLFHCTHAFLKQKASIHPSICQAVRPSICPSVYPLVCLSIRQSLHRLCFHKNPPLEICPCTMFWDPAQPRFILGCFYWIISLLNIQTKRNLVESCISGHSIYPLNFIGSRGMKKKILRKNVSE